MRQKLIATITLFFLLSSYLFGQTITPTIDTINIYKNKTGVRYRLYKKIWFPYDNSYAWFPAHINKQDSFVMDTTSYYFKVYDRRNRLFLEGRKASVYRWLQGKIIYYYKNGKIKKIEYTHEMRIDWANVLVNSDEINPLNIWKYYRRNGTIKKQKEHIIERIPENEKILYGVRPYQYYAIPQTTKFKRNGKIKSVRRKK